MIKKIFGIVFNPWVLLVLGLLALSLVIWIVGPLVAIGNWRPLESSTARLVLIGLIVLLVVARNMWKLVASRKRNDKVVDQLIAPASSADPGDGELKTLNERFAKALQTLKTAKFEQPQGGISGLWSGLSSRVGKRYLYELPWYVIIGAPGSGKTTALVNSGLNFPLAGSAGDPVVKGVGGTRNCDWWFTDQAVLIDTAGRYTSQDSHKEVDAKAWAGFLDLLKRSRPRQPLNGVLVAVSVTDLLTKSAAERRQDAANARARLQELQQHLGMRFPIYLLVTKCDLLSGFMETLGDVDKDTRAAPWGFTFKLDRQQHSDLGAFGPEFDALEQRLTDGLIGKLQLERDPQRRARIYGFPQQFEALKGVVKEYLEQVFSPSQFEAHPLLRGVYFVSGTQEGTPIDRMLGRIARTYRLERTVVPPLQASGKSYFLSRLLKEVVFSESGLAGTDLKWERRRGLLALGAYALVGVLAAITLTAWGISYFGNQRYVDKVGATAEEVKKLVQATPNRNSPDVLVLLPALEATRDLARAGFGPNDGGGVPLSLGFGLYQGKKLDAASQQAYRRMLIDAVLPRIALGIEEQLKNGNDNPELQYEALKAYVMLYDPERFDPQALKLYVTADWEFTLPRSVSTEQRAALESHLDALLAEGAVVSPLPEDKALVAQTRARLVATPLTERIFRRMKRQGLGAEFPEFTVAKAAGPGAALVFTRASGQPLTKGVPGFFTNDGYHKGFQREVERVAGQLADEESWVLGVTDANRQNALKSMDIKLQLNDEVRRLYLSEYAKTWEEFVADIKMVKTSNLAQAVQMARVLSAPDNPLVPLLKAMSRETTLRESKDVAGKVETKARDALQRSREELLRLLGNKAGATAVEPGQAIESIVDDRFIGLRQMVASPDGKLPAPVDGTVALINEVYTLLTAADTAVKGGNVPPPSEVPNKVKAEAARLPEPVRSLLNTLSVSGTSAALEITRSNLGNAINSEIGEFCRQAVAGRYPFARGSTRDATPEDFARLFAPGGLFDTFFQKNLVNFVDTSARPWKFKSVDGASMGTDSSTLLQFQHAAMIRDTFFRGGGNQISVRLDFKPLEMDATITQFILDVDGQLVKYAHGPQIPATVQWPGPRGSSQVRVQVTPVSASGASGLVADGPWALFKLFDKQQIEAAGGPERWKATFNVDGRRAAFLVTTSSVRNPFRLPELEQFSCPGKL